MGDDDTGLDLAEDDSLPWLEPVDDYDDEPGVSPVRLAILVVAGLALIAAVVGGIYWLGNNPRSGDGSLIVAEKGDYKIPADNSDARRFDGEGDASYAASEGAEPDGKIDPSRAPEAPAIGTASKAEQADTGAAKADAAKADTAKADAGDAATDAPIPAASAGGVIVQLGAFGSRQGADTAWASLGRRVPALKAYSPAITSASVGGGSVYRLRTSAKSRAAADSLCAAVRAKGENCIVVG